MSVGSKGIIIRIIGSVVDVWFEPKQVPDIFHAVVVKKDTQTFTMGFCNIWETVPYVVYQCILPMVFPEE